MESVGNSKDGEHQQLQESKVPATRRHELMNLKLGWESHELGRPQDQKDQRPMIPQFGKYPHLVLQTRRIMQVYDLTQRL